MTDQQQERFIITNWSLDKIPMTKALDRVAQVVNGGRVSNDGKQYSFATVFYDGVTIATDLNKASDRFVVYYDERYDQTLPGQEFEGQASMQISLQGPKEQLEALDELVNALVDPALQGLTIHILKQLQAAIEQQSKLNQQALELAKLETGLSEGGDA